MSLTIHLLGRPSMHHASGTVYRFRSQKSWALLAFLVMAERPPTRRHLSSLLFNEADDPMRALRWGLAEIRRGVGDDGSIDGDPVVLRLPPGTVVDIAVLRGGPWTDAVRLPGLGAELLDGWTVRGAPAFESWLLSAQRHVAGTSEAVLHEAALGSLSRRELDVALDYALRATMMTPLDENHHALLIRIYRLMGDDTAAERQLAACTALFETELGVAPGVAVHSAMRTTRAPAPATGPASVTAVIEAGAAAIAAGAIDAGIGSLHTAVTLADEAATPTLRFDARIKLAGALIHSLRGLDEEGQAALHEADRIALAADDPIGAARARAELGYVDFLRARYDRAERWLTDALELADGTPSIMAKAVTYLGSVASDRADYPRAVELLTRAVTLSRAAEDPRREAFAQSMLGRIRLLQGDLDTAAMHLDTSIELAARDHWLALLPWPQALLGEVHLAAHELDAAEASLRQAFARACQLGDPCWEGISARGLALLAEANGATDQAFYGLADARARANRLADPYVWLDAYILDAQCGLGRHHAHPETAEWVDTMRHLTSKTGMRDLIVRSLLHGAALGNDGDEHAAAVLAAEIDTTSPRHLSASTGPGRGSPARTSQASAR